MKPCIGGFILLFALIAGVIYVNRYVFQTFDKEQKLIGAADI